MHYINNQWVQGKGISFSSVNPATQEILWQGHEATHSEIDQAFQAAKMAFPNWSSLSLHTRIKYLEEFCALLAQEKEQFRCIIAKETGKTLWDAESEVTLMLNKLAISVDSYQTRCKEHFYELPKANAITRHKPHGIVAVFGPFNFPGHLPNGHIIPALLAGNTVVFKPSEFTPLVGQHMLKIWEKSGLPKGVLNMVQGGRKAGALITQHPELHGLFFTGSAKTGKLLAEQFAPHPEKILALELGGNNPLIVHRISDVQAAAYTAVQCAYLTSGQRCTAARRLIVTKGNERFLDELITIVKNIKVGPYTDIPEPFMGPVISAETAEKLLATQAELLKQGGVSLVPMLHLKKGTGLLSPGLIDVTAIKQRTDEEIFGPLLQIIHVADFEEALQEANATLYGLSAGLLSDSRDDYERFYKEIKAGVISWNGPLSATSKAPFGGIGKSGNHRPSAFYAADYCSYPVATMEAFSLSLPETLAPGIIL